MTKRAFLFAGQRAPEIGLASDLYAALIPLLGHLIRSRIPGVLTKEKLNQARYIMLGYFDNVQ